MSGTLKSAWANPRRLETEWPAPFYDDADSLPRRTYVEMRIAEILGLIVNFSKECEELNEVLEILSTGVREERKDLRQRRDYLAERLVILRNERARLTVEKQTMDRIN